MKAIAEPKAKILFMADPPFGIEPSPAFFHRVLQRNFGFVPKLRG
jgi:hypothetical protein